MKLSRRKFISFSFLIASASYFGFLFGSKNQSSKKINGNIIGANSKRGHLLRGNNFPKPEITERKKVVIVGGGVSGLSAARHLRKNGIDDFIMLELSDEIGGNSVSGKNVISEFPWGAHYLPIPNNNQEELISFLKYHNVITGFDNNGLPIYNEYYLCFDPQERLFINGHWQEGIIPEFGVSEGDKNEFNVFLKLMDQFRNAIGVDGKEAFAIPLSESSSDDKFTQFDKISMSDFLKQNNFSSEYLYWYVDYCCRDDYGTKINDTSAWAGIHYFAGRKGMGSSVNSNSVLTWPEGNAWLVKGMLSELEENHSKSACVVYKIYFEDIHVVVEYFDVVKNHNVKIIAQKVILSTPQFINNKILDSQERKDVTSKFSYSPWMVANISVKAYKEANGAPLSWDNVLYDSKSLGYVNACHQHLSRESQRQVLTYYLPLCDLSPEQERLSAFTKTHSEWTDFILQDLRKSQMDILNHVEEINIWLWGHAMIQPKVGFIFSEDRRRSLLPIEDKIYFAHSDLSGISNFEESFYQGIRAAKEVVKNFKAL